jgi:hypothetical protein
MYGLVSLVAAVAVIGCFWWAGLPVLAGFLAVVCGLGGILYLVAGAKRAGDGRSTTEREGNGRFQRDIPPPS